MEIIVNCAGTAGGNSSLERIICSIRVRLRGIRTECSKGIPAHIWDQNKKQSTGCLELLQGRGPMGGPGGLVLLGNSNVLELDLMEKTLAHFKNTCSRLLDGSNQGQKQASSWYVRPRRAALK